MKMPLTTHLPISMLAHQHARSPPATIGHATRTPQQLLLRVQEQQMPQSLSKNTALAEPQLLSHFPIARTFAVTNGLITSAKQILPMLFLMP
jgi:hypothetical protein